MAHVEYSAISATTWAELLNPGAIPIIPASTNTNLINVDQDLKHIILEAYDKMYTSQLEDYLLQYANR
jgi:hypothetical protein